MSEQGVFILETAGPEYRVSDAVSYHMVFSEWGPNGQWLYDPDKIKSVFEKSKAYSDLDSAMARARTKVLTTPNYLEWGICVVDNWKMNNYASMVNRET
jgi:hypothetical protein